MRKITVFMLIMIIIFTGCNKEHQTVNVTETATQTEVTTTETTVTSAPTKVSKKSTSAPTATTISELTEVTTTSAETEIVTERPHMLLSEILPDTPEKTDYTEKLVWRTAPTYDFARFTSWMCTITYGYFNEAGEFPYYTNENVYELSTHSFEI